MHALGALHTHTRRDRDKYVTINWKNIKRDKKTREIFLKERKDASNYSLPYDYHSIMHYGGDSFRNKEAKESKDGKKRWTITTKKKKYQKKIGQRKGLSRGDVKLIKRMYKCH